MRAVAVVIMLAACGDNLPATVDAQMHDAAEFVPGPNTVTIYVTDDTTDVRCRNEGKGPWGYADKISATEYRIHVDDTYEVVVACGLEWRGETVLHAQTIAAGDYDFLFCSAVQTIPAPLTVTVTGQMLQPGFVTMGDYASSSFAPWTYSLEVYKGLNDLIATDTTNRIAIRRELDITAATTLPTLDMTQEGTPTTTRPFSVIVPGGATEVDIQTLLFTRYGFTLMPGTPTSIREAPSTVLQPGDEQDVDVYAYNGNTSRYASLLLGSQSSVELMPMLAKSSLFYSAPDNKTLRADFKNLPPYTAIDISLYDVRSAQHASYTKEWFDAMQRSYFDLVLPPDFDPTWRVSLAPDYYRFVYVDDYRDELMRDTSRFDEVTNVLGN